MTYQMTIQDAYGVVSLPKEVFNKLNKTFFTSGTTRTVRLMLANPEQLSHVASLGVVLPQSYSMGWLRIELEADKGTL